MDRLSVTIDVQVNSIGSKAVSLRSNLLVANLIAAVKDKFNLDGNFQLQIEGARRSLRDDVPLDQAGVVDGHVLVFSPVIEASDTREAMLLGVRRTFSKQFRRVYLQEERGLSEFDLGWQPAIIGRQDRRDPSHNKLLAVPLDEVEGATTVSHHHACITEADGAFFVESVNDYNPTHLNDEQLRPWRKYPLPAGAQIQVGRIRLNFYIVG